MEVPMRRWLESIDDLPTLPRILLDLNNELAEPEPDMRAVAEVIATDPVVSAKLLRLVNSAYYQRMTAREIVSIQDAVTRVGLREIRSLVYTLSVFPLYPGSWKTIDREEFWGHCLATAVTSRVIHGTRAAGNGNGGESADLYYLAGLFHDLGIVVLEHHFHDEFVAVLRQAREEGMPLHLIEEDRWGLDHAEIGGHVAFRWNLPEPVVAAIQYHHRPNDAPPAFQSLTHSVRVADYLCLQNGGGIPELMETETLLAESLEPLNLDADGFHAIYQAGGDEIARARLLLQYAA